MSPHALSDVPATQLPFAAALQQPPLQGCIVSQDVVQAPLRQAIPDGQSFAWTQPQAPPTHCEPLALPAHVAHALPFVPHASGAVPATQVPFEQQPPLQAWFASQVVTQLPLVQERPVGQSLDVTQPQLVPVQTWPVAAMAQSTQSAPVAHALFAVPAMQTPFAQQPLGQGELAEQGDWQRCLVGSQPPDGIGQSETALQPHWPPSFTGSQRWPRASFAQAEQTTPPAPHAAGAVPATQVPLVAALQQPPLQGEALSQAVPHRCVVALQALPAGQSLAALQPHRVAPPTTRQAVPFALPAQEPQLGPPRAQAVGRLPGEQVLVAVSQQPVVQGVAESQCEPHAPLAQFWPVLQATQEPPAPQLSTVVPGWQVVPSQQPPLQERSPAQLVLQAPVVVLQAWPTGQSAGLVQPPPASPPVEIRSSPPASSVAASSVAASLPDARSGPEPSSQQCRSTQP